MSTFAIDETMVSIFKKYFIFDQIFNLIEYDSNMPRLHQELNQLKQNSYQNNYRFIFAFYDTQYYITHDRPGVTLLNLQRILHNLDIPNYFCLILSQQNISDELKYLQRTETTDDCAISSIVCHDWYYTTNVFNTINVEPDINPDLIYYKYQTLNRIKRFHRRVLFSILKDRNLLELGMISYNNTESIPNV